MNNDLKRIIDQVSRDKGIEPSVLIGTLEEAIRSAAKKKYGLSDNFEVAYNEETGEVEVFRFKEVVETVVNPETQIDLAEARRLDPESSLGDELGVKLDTSGFGRIAAQSAKQVIIQRMKDAERDLVFEDYRDRVGETVNGIVQRVDKGNILVNLGRAEALLPASEQIPRESYYRRGDRIRALIIDVKLVSRGPQIILSRTHPDFLAALFEAEVPEIAEGIVKIMAVAREPGSRAKIAVATEDSDIDPVGACVGLRGSRVQSVVQELKGEKIDIVPYSQDIARFIASALAPAVVVRVVVEEESRSMEVVVPDEQLSLAIGRKGQNVRLASKLSGWRIDVKSESRYQRALKEGYQSLIRLPGVGESMVDVLMEAGFGSAGDIANADLSQLAVLEGLDEERAVRLQEAAKEYMADLDKLDAEQNAIANWARSMNVPQAKAGGASAAGAGEEPPLLEAVFPEPSSGGAEAAEDGLTVPEAAEGGLAASEADQEENPPEAEDDARESDLR